MAIKFSIDPQPPVPGELYFSLADQLFQTAACTKTVSKTLMCDHRQEIAS